MKRVVKPSFHAASGLPIWFTAYSWSGQEWPILVSTPQDWEDLRDADGVTYSDAKQMIVMNRLLKRDRLILATLHELEHANLDYPGASEVHKVLLPVPGRQGVDPEEVHAGWYPAMMGGCLLRSGLLKFPPLPRASKRSRSSFEIFAEFYAKARR